MLRRITSGAVLLVFALAVSVAGASGAPSPRPEREASGRSSERAGELPVGSTHDNPAPSPDGFYLRGSNGDGFAVNVTPDLVGGHAGTVRVEAGELGDGVSYSARGNLAGEGIRVDLGRFGRIDLRWKPNGQVKERHGKCGHFPHDVFFDDGSYVGTVRLRGGDGFTAATAHRIRWSRSWYSSSSGCPFAVSEGFPGPGAILEVGQGEHRVHPVELFVVQNGPGAEVLYQASQSEKIGRISVSRHVTVAGGPKTITVGPGFQTGEVSPPAPFSGTGRFERTEHARGTWLGDLSVEFPDHTTVPLAGKSFEAIFHSGYYEIHEGL